MLDYLAVGQGLRSFDIDPEEQELVCCQDFGSNFVAEMSGG